MCDLANGTIVEITCTPANGRAVSDLSVHWDTVTDVKIFNFLSNKRKPWKNFI